MGLLESNDHIVSKLSEIPVPAALIGAAGAGLLYKKYRDKKKFEKKWGLSKPNKITKNTTIRSQLDDVLASNIKKEKEK